MIMHTAVHAKGMAVLKQFVSGWWYVPEEDRQAVNAQVGLLIMFFQMSITMGFTAPKVIKI